MFSKFPNNYFIILTYYLVILNGDLAMVFISTVNFTLLYKNQIIKFCFYSLAFWFPALLSAEIGFLGCRVRGRISGRKFPERCSWTVGECEL